jgi:type IV pilus assembly protein PilM
MLFGSSCVGIDLRMDTIKAAYLIRRGNRIRIKDLYQMENPLGKTVINGSKEQSIIKECFKKISERFPSKNVVIGVSSNNIILRHVQLPILSKKELKEAIFWETQEFSSVFNNNFVSDYEILERQKENFRILLVGASNQLIQDYIKIAYESGISLSALDIYPLAHARVLKLQKISNVIAILDLEPCHSEITLVDNGNIIFIRSLDFCYTKTIQNKIESFKYDPKVIPPEFQNLLIELSRCIKFYSLHSNGSGIDEIIITGEGRKLQFLKAILSKFLDVGVHIESKLKHDLSNNSINVNHNPMEFFSAIGFALRGGG